MIDLKTLLRRAAIVLGVILVFFVILAIGFRVRAGRAYARAMAAEQKGDLVVAAGFYGRAIRQHSPFNGAIQRQSRERLRAIAERYEADGQTDKARQTYQTLLSALASVETGWSGNGARLDELEAKVQSLLPPPPERIDKKEQTP